VEQNTPRRLAILRVDVEEFDRAMHYNGPLRANLGLPPDCEVLGWSRHIYFDSNQVAVKLACPAFREYTGGHIPPVRVVFDKIPLMPGDAVAAKRVFVRWEGPAVDRAAYLPEVAAEQEARDEACWREAKRLSKAGKALGWLNSFIGGYTPAPPAFAAGDRVRLKGAQPDLAGVVVSVGVPLEGGTGCFFPLGVPVVTWKRDDTGGTCVLTETNAVALLEKLPPEPATTFTVALTSPGPDAAGDLLDPAGVELPAGGKFYEAVKEATEAVCKAFTGNLARAQAVLTLEQAREGKRCRICGGPDGGEPWTYDYGLEHAHTRCAEPELYRARYGDKAPPVLAAVTGEGDKGEYPLEEGEPGTVKAPAKSSPCSKCGQPTPEDDLEAVATPYRFVKVCRACREKR
jgi:hypothetical protein